MTTFLSFPGVGRPSCGDWRVGAVLLAVLGLGAIAKAAAPVPDDVSAGPVVRQVIYTAQLSDAEARFRMVLRVESAPRAGGDLELLEGPLAVLPERLPAGVSLRRDGDRFALRLARAGECEVALEFLARVRLDDPWREVRFVGPLAGIARLEASEEQGAEIELLRGTVAADAGSARGGLRGILGGSREVALRWRPRPRQDSRRAVVTCDTTAALRATPGVLQLATEFRYQVLQGAVSALEVGVPIHHSLTRVEGDGIRDWQITRENGVALLRVDLMHPVETNGLLRLHSEQAVEALPFRGELTLPEPRGMDRESGSILLSAEDVLLGSTPVAGCRQVNPTPEAQVAYRFHGRPAVLGLELLRLEPVLTAADRLRIQVEDHRVITEHTLALTVEKAGVFALELGPLHAVPVTEVRSDGLESWKVRDDRLLVSFTNRVLGARTVGVRLEQAWREFPHELRARPLALTGAVRQTAQISVTAAPGIQVKTAALGALREVPVQQLDAGGESGLGYLALQADWDLQLGIERLAPRVVADSFHLVTVGEGLLGGSATLRYAILNQGMQEFRLRVPAAWRNVDFTGPNIRHKDHEGEVWTIGLQDKAWGAYTLVVTYDEPFDPAAAKLIIGGLRALEVERETGSTAITSAGGLELREMTVPPGMERIDEAELADGDRALVTRPVLLAYRHSGDIGQTSLTLEARRFEAGSVLAAVADRTQLTTVLTEDGQMLTQAGFMVKNHDKQFQSFQLPARADLWSAFVNGGPVKAERQDDLILVPLPRGLDRDQVIVVELVYAQQAGTLRGWRPRNLVLAAPATDVQTTYAEWEVFLPSRCLLKGLEGPMQVARGTTYGWLEAWVEFTSTCRDVVTHHVGALLFFGFLALLAAVITAAVRRGFQGLVTLLAAVCIIAILGGMLLPSLAKAKSKAQGISSLNSMKQIALAARLYAGDHQDHLPATFEDMRTYLGSDTVTIDPQTGRRFIYVGGMLPEPPAPDTLLAYSPEPMGGRRTVALVDGSSQIVPEERFHQMLQRTLAGTAIPGAATAVQQAQAGQANNPAPSPTAPAAALPFAVGLRPIRIELPRTGQRLVFTKVLNVRREPLSVRAWVVRGPLWNGLRGVAEASVFIAGLLLVVRAWRRPGASSLTLAFALALLLGSVVDLLLVTRLLGVALILAVPLAVLASLIWLFRGRLARLKVRTPPALTPEVPASPSPALLLLGIAWILPGLLQAAAEPAPGLSADDARILSAEYRATVDGETAALEAEFRMESTRDGCTVMLLSDEAAVDAFEAEPRQARLLRRPGGVAVWLPRRGEARVTLKALVRTSGSEQGRRLAFGIPPALVSRLAAVINEPGATVVFPAAVACTTRAAGSQTQVEATLGTTPRVELHWTPKVKRAADEAATVFGTTSARATVGVGALNCVTRLDLRVSQGELRTLRVQLPEGHRLLRVEGDLVRTWTAEPASTNQPPVLQLLFTRPVSADARVQLETEMPLTTLPATVPVDIPHPLDLKRETGWIALGGGEELGLSVDGQEGLQKADAADLAQTDPGKGPVTAAFQFLRPGFRLTVRAESLQPHIEVTARHVFRAGLEEARLESFLHYRVQRAGVFALRCQIPAGYRVQAIDAPGTDATPARPFAWVERGAETNRTAEITLPARTLGSLSLRLQCVRALPALLPTLEVPHATPLGADAIDTHLVVVAEPGVQLRPETASGLSEVPATSVAGGISGLAFKVLARDAPDDWQLRLATQRVESWVRAEIVHWLTLGDGIATGRAVVRFEVQNAPAREFRLRMPAAFRNVEVQAPNLRRRDRDGLDWRIELQNRVSGVVMVQVSWDQAWMAAASGEDSAVECVGVTAPGVERETGYFAVGTRTQLELSARAIPEGFLKADTQELPDWAGRPEVTTVLAFRYLRPGGVLALAAKRFDPAAMLQALVDEAQLTTVVAEDGQMMTEVSLSVRNNGRQFLALHLPPGTEVWSAFVNGQPVRPVRRDDQVLLPLERPAGNAPTLPVQWTYVGSRPFPARSGRVELASPAVDLPIKNARWELYLPMDFDYRKFGGTMSYDIGAARVVAAFSADEYSQAESSRRRAERQQVSNSILAVRSSLAKGELEEANRAYVMAQRYGLKKGQAEVEQLDRELRLAQSGNLRRAQENLLLANNAAAGNQTQAAASNYDDQVAGQQWARVQQAQDVAPATVRPLRVNLPTRGLRHTFTQPLQMEIGQPLRIEFQAVNLRAPDWTQRAAWSAAILGLLWAASAALLRRKQRVAAQAR